MVSLSSGQFHYHTLKSDVISFLIEWFIWLTILFIQQKFKILSLQQENENTTLSNENISHSNAPRENTVDCI